VKNIKDSNDQLKPGILRRRVLVAFFLFAGLVVGMLVAILLRLPVSRQEAASEDLSATIQSAATRSSSTGESDSGSSSSSAQTLSSPPEPPLPSQTPIPLPTPDPWTGDERVNLLVLGVDYADWDSPDRLGPPRSDTMILLTIDPASKTAGMLSIPRDLWVDIPGMVRPNRINAAHRFGELYELPGGGPALAARTVENLLGVPVHYYTRIDFSVFERLIDEIGGVEVDVPAEIQVDPIGPGNTVVLQPGRQTLDGPTALAYARNRSTQGDEADRSRRQQQIILAIRERLVRLDGLPVLVSKAPGLYSELREGIVTNLTLQEAIQLAWLAAQIHPQDIRTAVIGPNEVIFDTTEEGWAVYRPIPERIRWLVQGFFATP
jgi:polyisoprenyl-teichoic acid--peptidoglycan teichoic acid transferase